MQITKDGNYTGTLEGTALALGFFDGLHTGHKAVISAAVNEARKAKLAPAVFTFSMNGEGPKGDLLLTPEQKHRALEEFGVEFCFEPGFSSFHDLSPRQFFDQMLVGQYKAKAVFCGEDFGFGAKRAGNAALLGGFCAEAGILFNALPMAYWRGAAVSSSRIRRALAAGQIEEANTMLGRPYEIELPVRHGKGLGHTLGFPTLNQVYPEGMQAPKYGVYITQTLIDGRAWPSATGYGTRPTVNGEQPTCETFVPGFSGNLYGARIRVRFYKYLSGSVKFESAEKLADAVREWAGEALAFFKDK